MAWPELTWQGERSGPLAGIRVVDMSSVVLGPFATQIFADLGAEVIKVENGGDMMRKAGASPTGDIGPIFAALNRNKKSINIDASDPAQKAVLLELLSSADVFFHNVRMAGMERLGLDYESIAKINPDIIYIHCAGYGSDGPYAPLQAFDDLVQAASGFASLSEKRDGGRPQFSPSLIVDKVTGLFATQATMAAIIARQNGAGGQYVQVPMMECFTWFHMVENLWGETYLPGNGRVGYTRSLNPRRRPYPTKDGYIAIVPYSEKQWQRFFELAGKPGLFSEPRFATQEARKENADAIYAEIELASASKTSNEWLPLLAENNIPAMRYNRMDDVLNDPHLQEVGFFEERAIAGGDTYRSMKHPVTYSKTPASYYGDPSSLDADGDEIRRGLGKE